MLLKIGNVKRGEHVARVDHDNTAVRLAIGFAITALEEFHKGNVNLALTNLKLAGEYASEAKIEIK